mgnify:CR=1 FL=1
MPERNDLDPLRPTLRDPNPENLTEKQILEAIYVYLAEAYNAPAPDKPSPHRTALNRFFPAFSNLYLSGAILKPFNGLYVNLRRQPIKR